MELFEYSACQLAEMLRKGETTSRAITEAALARIEATEAKLHSFNMVTKETALAQADLVDKKALQGKSCQPWQVFGGRQR